MLSEDKDTFMVERNGKPVGTWPGSSYLGETADFEVLRGDLDGDRRAELIVANHDSTGAGLALNNWTIYIFSDGEFLGFNSPLSFSVQEYGAFGTFVTAGSGVNILTTGWMSRKGKGKRGNGLYLVGQWWQYKSGALHPVPNRRMVARRYLTSFERERLQTVDSAQVPHRWLTYPNAELLNVDPRLETRKQTSKRCVIEGVTVRKSNAERFVKLDFKPDGEEPITCIYAHDDVDESELELTYLGDASTGLIYPFRYMTSQPEDWLRGRRATLKTYRDDAGEAQYHVLWLERNSRTT
jgi:hypothetical protein